jgi:ferrous iron transport protein A
MTRNIVAEPRPLSAFPKGTTVKVHSLLGGGKARCRLCALGITPGTQITLRSHGAGPCRLRVRGSDLVLGHGMADKILASLM